MKIPRQQFLLERAARRGATNPEPCDFAVWKWLVEEGLSAYQAAAEMKVEVKRGHEAGFCFDRFGMTRSAVPGGRTVCIGGEHEDHYDPDFYIYNDVIVLDAEERCLAIYNYPVEDFPPTDFHTATFVAGGPGGGTILIVGGLGYPDERRPGCTRVYRLSLRDYRIEAVATTGDAPGWIWKHRARLDGSRIVVSRGRIDVGEGERRNVDDYALDTKTWAWQRLTTRPVQEWVVEREDGGEVLLSDFSVGLFYDENPELLETAKVLPETVDFEALGIDLDPRVRLRKAGMHLDRDLWLSLHVPPLAHERLEVGGIMEEMEGIEDIDGSDIEDRVLNDSDDQSDGAEAWLRLTAFDACYLRYFHDYEALRILIEGAIPAEEAQEIVEDARAKMASLQGAACRSRLVHGQVAERP